MNMIIRLYNRLLTFFGEQTGHIFIGLVEGPHSVLVELAAFFGEDQLLEASVLLHAPAGDVALALHEL